jgi:predicted nucleotidyltransferase
MDLIERLHSKGLIKPPGFVIGGTQYLTVMGSQAYAVANDDSDMDIYGWCIPARDYVFPHLRGEIEGFGTKGNRFEQFQMHHIVEKDYGKEYDLNIYNIVKYFQLVMDNNPNMIDSLFTHQQCVIKSTKVSDHVRDNRKIFLCKKAWHTFKGYAYAQMHKMKIKEPDPTSVRYATIQKYGYDVKYAYHIVRLLNEVEQILNDQDLDLHRNNDQLKDIRAGNWKAEQIEEYFTMKEASLELAYNNSTLRNRPDEPAIKKILLECLEEYYGTLDGMIETADQYKTMLRQIQQIVSKV